MVNPTRASRRGLATALLIVTSCLSSVAASAAPALTGQQREGAARFQALLGQSVECGTTGISAAVATRDGVIWTGTAGKADVTTGEPVRPEMLFGIGSITKTFVAVVILQLVEEGRLNLQDTPARILGAAVDGIANADTATIAQLLNHTSGIPSWEDQPRWIRDGRGDRLDPTRIWGKTQTLPYIQHQPPTDVPGARHSYSNTNYTLLGMVVEKVTGRELAGELRRRVLTPIGIEDVYLEGFEPLPAQRLVRRYHYATAEYRETAGLNAAFAEVRPGLIDVSRSNLSVEWAAGGMVATARDLVMFGVALRDGRLLKPQSMKFMTQWFAIDKQRWIGHNVFRRVFPDGSAPTLIGHDGGVLGFSASWYWLEDADAVFAVMRNSGSMHSGAVASPCVPERTIGRKEFAMAARQMAADRSR